MIFVRMEAVGAEPILFLNVLMREIFINFFSGGVQ